MSMSPQSLKLASSIATAARSYGKLRNLVRGALAEPDAAHILADVATRLMKGVESMKDEAARPYVSFKATVSVLAKEAGLSVSLKSVDGAYVCTIGKAEAKPVPAPVVAAAPAAAPESGESDGEPTTAPAIDALQVALSMVLANMDKPAVMAAIRAKLQAMAGE